MEAASGLALEEGDKLLSALSDVWAQMRSDLERARLEARQLEQQNLLLCKELKKQREDASPRSRASPAAPQAGGAEDDGDASCPQPLVELRAARSGGRKQTGSSFGSMVSDTSEAAGIGGACKATFSKQNRDASLLKKLFNEIDRSRIGIITPSDLDWLIRKVQRGSKDSFMRATSPFSSLEHIEDVVLGLNEACGEEDEFGSELNAAGVAGINFETFRTLLTEDSLPVILGEELADEVLFLRRMIMQYHTQRMVNSFVGVKSMATEDPKKQRAAADEAAHAYHVRLLERMEPFIGILIFSNAIILGISSDVEHDWMGWQIIEYIFTAAFTAELVLKLMASGWKQFFLGESMLWNIFDFVVVSFAILEVAVTVSKDIVTDTNIQAQQVRILRIARLVRLTRVVRVLQFKAFQDLQLMLQGVLFGLRTLFWAIILLFFVIYCVGLLVRNIIGLDHLHGQVCDSAAAAAGANAVSASEALGGSMCSDAEMHLVRYYPELFSSMTHTMFTVFRCLTDGCTSVDGTPLLVTMREVYGLPFLAFYCLIMCFVTFGLFNLIMAVFVENTMEAAKNHRAGRSHDEEDQARVAQQLYWLVGKFSQGKVGHYKSELPGVEILRKISDFVQSKWMYLITRDKKRNGQNWIRAKDEANFLGGLMQVSREDFNVLVQDPRVRKIFDDLDLNPGSREGLFDVLDADGNGYLEADEFVNGIMKLRGTPDKCDSIAALLGIRALQSRVKLLHSTSLKNEQRLEKVLDLFSSRASGRRLSTTRSVRSVLRRSSRAWTKEPGIIHTTSCQSSRDGSKKSVTFNGTASPHPDNGEAAEISAVDDAGRQVYSV